MPNPPEQESRSEESTPIESWVDEYGDTLYRFAYSKIGDEATAEDLVQETFIAVLTAKNPFRGESAVSTWLLAILRRKIVDHFRRQSRSVATVTATGEEAIVGRPCPKHWDDDPSAIYESQEFRITFDSCIEKLPDHFAEVFILREIRRKSPKDICEILGISSTNLSMRLHRCRLAIRDCLQQNWFQEKA